MSPVPSITALVAAAASPVAIPVPTPSTPVDAVVTAVPVEPPIPDPAALVRVPSPFATSTVLPSAATKVLTDYPVSADES